MMASFGSFRVSKGVRISASSRGLRAHVGPRGSRLHMGGGRTGVSTGAGPFTYYTSGGSGSRSGTRTSGGPTKAPLAQAQKEEEFQRLRRELLSILEIHRVDFPAAQKPILPPPDLPKIDHFLERREKEMLAGISLLKRAERKEAKSRARHLASQDLEAETQRQIAQHEEDQAEIDAEWDRLNANDPETVIAIIDAAFEDNDAPAAPVDVDDSTLNLVVLAPTIDEIPEQKPAVTPSGKPTVKKMTKQERFDMYLTLVCGHALATIKEALAVAPGVSDVKAVVVRQSGPNVYGDTGMEALLAAKYARSNLDRVRWQEALPSDIVQEAADDLLWNLKGRPPQMQPLDLDDEPELKSFIDVLSERLLVAK